MEARPEVYREGAAGDLLPAFSLSCSDMFAAADDDDGSVTRAPLCPPYRGFLPSAASDVHKRG
jgi:hypothetical protein